jgi:hypothetical protein
MTAAPTPRPLTPEQQTTAARWLPLARGIAANHWRERRNADEPPDFDEVESAAVLGLVLAVRRYDQTRDRDGNLLERHLSYGIGMAIVDNVHRKHPHLGDARKFSRTGEAVPAFVELPASRNRAGHSDHQHTCDTDIPAPTPIPSEARRMPALKLVAYTETDAAAEPNAPLDVVQRLIAEHPDAVGPIVVVRPTGERTVYLSEPALEVLARLVDDGREAAARKPVRCRQCSRTVEADGMTCRFCVGRAKRAERREAVEAGRRDGFGGG